MSNHSIRLRGAWELFEGSKSESDDRTAGKGERIALPKIWAERPLVPFRLVRRFGSPPIDPATETVILTLDDIQGLVRASLNGQDADLRQDGDRWTIAGPFAERNVLALEIDPTDWSEANLQRPWGSIALEVSALP